MKKGYHPYLRNVPEQPSSKALALDQEEYDSSDDEAVNKVYLGARGGDAEKWRLLYLEEKHQKEELAEFIRQMLDSRRAKK
jgi:hypothetical protein